MFWGCPSGKFVLVPVYCGRIWQEVCFGSYFFSVHCGFIRREFFLVPIFFSFYCVSIWREVCVGSYFFSFYCGRIWQEVFSVPIFLALVVAASGVNLFWFQFFSFILAASIGKFVLVPIF